jgi:hypothetical protein
LFIVGSHNSIDSHCWQSQFNLFSALSGAHTRPVRSSNRVTQTNLYDDSYYEDEEEYHEEDSDEGSESYPPDDSGDESGDYDDDEYDNGDDDEYDNGDDDAFRVGMTTLRVTRLTSM